MPICRGPVNSSHKWPVTRKIFPFGDVIMGIRHYTYSRAPFNSNGLALILTWISNYIHYKMWDEFTYLFQDFNSSAVEVLEWISNFNQHFTGHVITYAWYEIINVINWLLVVHGIGWVAPFVLQIKFRCSASHMQSWKDYVFRRLENEIPWKFISGAHHSAPVPYLKRLHFITEMCTWINESLNFCSSALELSCKNPWIYQLLNISNKSIYIYINHFYNRHLPSPPHLAETDVHRSTKQSIKAPHYWPLVNGIHGLKWFPSKRPWVWKLCPCSPHKGQRRGALMFSLICAGINGWVNNRKAGDLRRHRVHYDVTVMRWHDLIISHKMVSFFVGFFSADIMVRS